MKLPNFQKEKSLARKGYKIIVGVDEAGRGPLAGPLTAAAIAVSGPISNFCPYGTSPAGRQFPISKQTRKNKLYKIRDSKKLTSRQRERWYKILTGHPQIKWAAASVGPKTIDKINVSRAANLAAGRAFRKLIAKILKRSAARQKLFVLLDGSLYLPKILDSRFYFLNSQTIIKGDEKVWSIAAASVIAKVTRDRKMRRLSKKYPGYGFEIHKGYGTKLHYRRLKKFGPSEIHRKTFIKPFLKIKN